MFLNKMQEMNIITGKSIPEFFSQAPISPNVKVSVVIPVQNEEKYIFQCLAAFSKQTDVYGNKLDPDQFEILVLANNCHDKSVELTAQFQSENPDLNLYFEEVILPTELSNIGYVRKTLMDSAFKRLIQNGHGTIMTTDGDTRVSPDWIAQTISEIGRGAEVVGGRIELYTDELHGLDQFARLLHLKDERYRLLVAELEGKIIGDKYDPVPRHHQHFNGSFAITTDCYERSGGVPVVKHLEDCAFFDRLQTFDAKIRHSFNVLVSTSARCAGRAQIGLSQQLNEWKNYNNSIENYYVESCDSVEKRLNTKRNLITVWQLKNKINRTEFYNMIKGNIPETIALDYDLFIGCCYFGEWFAQISKHENDAGNISKEPIEEAIENLEKMLLKSPQQDFVQTSIL
jgi:glycosyltransferase involved in cell wall biosynthesis